MPDDSPATARAFPLAAADQCVKCGLCLPHCPTYRLTLDEAESPRGRIALMQGLATGALAASPALQAHLDRCLTCRACEVVCPAGVPYGRLIDAAREELAAREPRRARLARVLAALLTRPWLRLLGVLPLWLYQRLGLQRRVRAGRLLGRGRLARLESLLPRLHLPRLPRPASTRSRERVMLFANCTSPLVEPQALAAGVDLLERLGCAVDVPRGQTCCGAIGQHAGLAAGARACAGRNLAAFAGTAPVVGIASGCTAELLEYGRHSADPAAAAFAGRVRDLLAYIAGHPQQARLRFRPLAARVLLHLPCTLRNVVRAEGAAAALLARIPDLRVEIMDSGCCGAAGSYFLSQPAMADALAQPNVERVAAARPDYVLSANTGCAMHLEAALRRAGISAPVWHPLRLLAQQVER
jgi:glycolate oxidase iron-sulfur subunit